MAKPLKTPQKKRRIRPRTIIIFVVMTAIVCVSVFLFVNRETDLDRLQMTAVDMIDDSIIETNVRTDFELDFEVEDYSIYGQTFSVYETGHEIGDNNELSGMMIQLRSVETEKELNFIAGESLDSGIDLGTLEPGLYEIYIYDHYDKKRLCFSEAINSDTFSSMRNQGRVTDVVLNADKEFLSDYGITFKKNYAFLSVMDNIPQVRNVDIVLDPGGQVYSDVTMTTDPGTITDLMTESETTLEFANLVKTELEAKGLRVLLAREDESGVSYYGTSGRAGEGYKAKAKAFIGFSVYEDDEVISPYLITGRNTSGLLANDIAYMLQGQDLRLASISSLDSLEDSVIYDPGTAVSEDGPVYDAYPQLRETGGKHTFAGTMSQASSNAQYATSFGMESVVLMLANASNEDSVNYYQEHKEEMAKYLAEAICRYYGIQGDESETANQ